MQAIVSLLESLSICANLLVELHRINLELSSMEVSIVNLILILVCNHCEGIHLDVQTCSAGQSETQIVVSAIQVDSRSSNRLTCCLVRNSHVTDVGPRLAILATLDEHVLDMTEVVVTTCYVNLDRTRNGILEGNLQIVRSQNSLMPVAMPEGARLTIDQSTNVLTFSLIASIT